MSNGSGETFNSKTDYSFGNEPYMVYFTTPDADNLILTIEHKLTCDRWCGRYSSQHIQTLTSKANSYKPFHTFLKMIYQALMKKSNSVSLEFITKNQMEVLFQKKSSSKGSSTPSMDDGEASKTSLTPSNTRYLIVIYYTEYDCVRYPLPLAYEEPNIEILKNLIQNLRNENEQLRKPNKEIEKLTREKRDIEEAFRKLQVESANEVKHVRKQYDELVRELHIQTADIEKLKKQLAQQSDQLQRAPELEEKVILLKKELRNAKNEIEQLRAENTKYYLSKQQIHSDSRSSVTKTRSTRSPSPKISSSPRVERSRSPTPTRRATGSSVEKRGATSRSSSSERRISGYESPKTTSKSALPKHLIPTSSSSSSTRNSRSMSPSLRSKTPTKDERKGSSSSSASRKVPSSPSRGRPLESPRRSRTSATEEKKSRHKPSKKTYYDTSEDESELASNADMYSSQASPYNSDDYSDYSFSSVSERRGSSSHRSSSNKRKQVAPTTSSSNRSHSKGKHR
ncbi:hypothetical protein C9374_014106 [Naegleria lovaniensis]|uniref:Coiled-coil domain-containing protein 61 n=1 Tax=Naegleria lovaniensis TaxID=51637 RepID=A0AA88KQC8_NAELO|nr:uncharacterized protein C9374_014106 [Naegleria lovaniensis]KAG2389546.1 hypothetical protein C9374_014106 [Naegleria lovaniensis]